jgi:hypothetical protein
LEKNPPGEEAEELANLRARLQVVSRCAKQLEWSVVKVNESSGAFASFQLALLKKSVTWFLQAATSKRGDTSSPKLFYVDVVYDSLEFHRTTINYLTGQKAIRNTN